jgi:hypothetical protein
MEGKVLKRISKKVVKILPLKPSTQMITVSKY